MRDSVARVPARTLAAGQAQRPPLSFGLDHCDNHDGMSHVTVVGPYLTLTVASMPSDWFILVCIQFMFYDYLSLLALIFSIPARTCPHDTCLLWLQVSRWTR